MSLDPFFSLSPLSPPFLPQCGFLYHYPSWPHARLSSMLSRAKQQVKSILDGRVFWWVVIGVAIVLLVMLLI